MGSRSVIGSIMVGMGRYQWLDFKLNCRKIGSLRRVDQHSVREDHIIGHAILPNSPAETLVNAGRM
jgi:hypothetical protein